MCAGEWKVMQLATVSPLADNFGAGIVTVAVTVVDIEGDSIAGNGVLNGSELLQAMRTETKSRFSELVGIGFAVEFDVRKFPEVRVDNASGSLPDEVTGISFDNKSVETPGCRGSAAGKIG